MDLGVSAYSCAFWPAVESGADSGAGPSGLRPAFLKESLAAGHRDEVLTHLTSVVGLLARGRGPPALAAFLAGAALHALPRKDGSIRPIVVGECLRRLVAKVLCAAYQQQASHLLWPLQIGVAQPLGTEVGLRTARQWVERHKLDRNAVFLKMDFRNAFNTVSRQAFIDQCRLHMPGLSPWVEWCYKNPSNLYFGRTNISSQTGVQQGDPLGPLLFALALQPLLRDLSDWRSTPEGAGLKLVFSYLDDCCIAGDFRTIGLALSRFATAARSIGLELCSDKCEVIPAAGLNTAADTAAFPADIKWVREGNFELLGGPVGTVEYCEEHTRARVQKAQHILKAIGDMHDPQVALLLLRYCASFSKLVYSTRIVAPDAHASSLREFDAAVRDCFESFTCLRPSGQAWELGSLSTRQGGLGLRSAAKHSTAAFLASASSCYNLCRALDPSFEWVFSADGSAEFRSLATFNTSVGPANSVAVSATEALRQQDLSRLIDDRAVALLGDASVASLSFQAHLKLVSAPDAGRWLHAVPAKDTDNIVSPDLFNVMLQRRLRIPIFDSEHFCPQCDGVVDVYGDHCITCCGGGDRTKRHNLLRNCTHNLCSMTGLSSELERPGLLRPRPFMGGLPEDGVASEGLQSAEQRRPADVYIPRWFRGVPACLDFAVTSGLRSDNIRDSARDPSAVVTAYEGYKCSHLDTKAHCRSEGMAFVPMVMEGHGGSWGQEAAKFWSKLAKTHALASGELRSSVLSAFLGSMSVILHRENARAIIRRSPLRATSLRSHEACVSMAAAVLTPDA